MRISDWRSDVCSSDLALHLVAVFLKEAVAEEAQRVGIGGQLLDDEVVVLTGFDKGAVLTNLRADFLVLLLVRLGERLHSRVGVAARNQVELMQRVAGAGRGRRAIDADGDGRKRRVDRKSTRLNSSH